MTHKHKIGDLVYIKHAEFKKSDFNKCIKQFEKNEVTFYKFSYQSDEDGYYKVVNYNFGNNLKIGDLSCDFPQGLFLLYLNKVEKLIPSKSNMSELESFETFEGEIIVHMSGDLSCQPYYSFINQVVNCENGKIIGLNYMEECGNTYIPITSTIDDDISCMSGNDVHRTYRKGDLDVVHYIRIPGSVINNRVFQNLSNIFINNIKTCEQISQRRLTGACKEFTYDDCLEGCIIDVTNFRIYKTRVKILGISFPWKTRVF